MRSQRPSPQLLCTPERVTGPQGRSCGPTLRSPRHCCSHAAPLPRPAAPAPARPSTSPAPSGSPMPVAPHATGRPRRCRRGGVRRRPLHPRQGHWQRRCLRHRHVVGRAGERHPVAAGLREVLHRAVDGGRCTVRVRRLRKPERYRRESVWRWLWQAREHGVPYATAHILNTTGETRPYMVKVFAMYLLSATLRNTS